MTEPGRITVFAKGKSHVAAHLWNFEVGSPTPKPEHVHFLKTEITPLVVRTMEALIIGSTSRTDTNARNMKLATDRANAIEDEVARLNLTMLSTATQIAVGEEAARLLGVPDGVEDGRWRGVFLTINTPALVPPPPPPPPKTIKQRTRAVVLLEDTSRGRGVPPEERRAEASRRLAQTIMDLDGVVHEDFAEINENFTITRITIRESSTKTNLVVVRTTVKYLHVSFEWGPVSDRMVATDGSKGALLVDETRGGKQTRLTSHQTAKWEYNPLKEFRNL